MEFPWIETILLICVISLCLSLAGYAKTSGELKSYQKGFEDCANIMGVLYALTSSQTCELVEKVRNETAVKNKQELEEHDDSD